MSEEKGIWTAEAWKTPELHVTINTGKEKKEENIDRDSIRDFTVFDIVIERLGLLKGDKEIVVEVDGKVIKPLEAQKVAASSAMEIVIHPSNIKEKLVPPETKKPVVVDRKYHQHRGIVGGHKVADRHKDEHAQIFHNDEIKMHKTEA